MSMTQPHFRQTKWWCRSLPSNRAPLPGWCKRRTKPNSTSVSRTRYTVVRESPGMCFFYGLVNLIRRGMGVVLLQDRLEDVPALDRQRQPPLATQRLRIFAAVARCPASTSALGWKSIPSEHLESFAIRGAALRGEPFRDHAREMLRHAPRERRDHLEHRATRQGHHQVQALATGGLEQALQTQLLQHAAHERRRFPHGLPGQRRVGIEVNVMRSARSARGMREPQVWSSTAPICASRGIDASELHTKYGSSSDRGLRPASDPARRQLDGAGRTRARLRWSPG